MLDQYFRLLLRLESARVMGAMHPQIHIYEFMVCRPCCDHVAAAEGTSRRQFDAAPDIGPMVNINT